MSMTQPQQEALSFFAESKNQAFFKIEYSKDGGMPTDLVPAFILNFKHELDAL